MTNEPTKNEAIDTEIKTWRETDEGTIRIEENDETISKEEFKKRFLDVTRPDPNDVNREAELLLILKESLDTKGDKIRLTKHLNTILKDEQRRRLKDKFLKAS